jgi:hypothetical protein
MQQLAIAMEEILATVEPKLLSPHLAKLADMQGSLYSSADLKGGSSSPR